MTGVNKTKRIQLDDMVFCWRWKIDMSLESNGALFMENIKKDAGLTRLLGGVVMLVGLLSMVSPLVAGLSVTMAVGIMLAIGGIGQLVFAVKTGTGLFSIVMAALTVILGAYMLSNIGAALASLTIYIAAFFIIGGITEAIMAFQLKPASGWGWALFSGLITVLLGAMIWNQFPLTGEWAIGTLVGIKLVFSGWSLLMFGMVARSAAKA